LSAHMGTHVDSPAHYCSGGTTVDALKLDALVGPALVIEATQVDVLSADVLEGLPIPPSSDRLLFRTRNSELWSTASGRFDEGFVGISEDGAQWLVERGLRLVGVDYLSIGPFHDPAPAHKVLLGAGVIALEGLDLRGIAPGAYQLVCLPLKIAGAEAAPARVILID